MFSPALRAKELQAIGTDISAYQLAQAMEQEKLASIRRPTEEQKKLRVKQLKELYEKNVESYSKRKVTFCFAYEYLLKTMFNSLLELERNYAKQTLELFDEEKFVDLNVLNKSQRKEYREYVFSMYRAVRGSTDVFDELNAAMEDELTTSIEDMVKALTEMGFTKSDALVALEKNEYDVNEAASALLTGEKRMISSSQSMTFLGKRNVSDNHVLEHRSTSEIWNSSPKTRSRSNEQAADKRLTSPSLAKKVGIWFKNKRTPPKLKSRSNLIDLSEAFTVTLGNQVKTMFNLRICVEDLATVFDPMGDEAMSNARCARILSTIYSSTLTGVVHPIDATDWQTYSDKFQRQSSNSSFFDNCLKTTELHFDSLDTQLNAIESELRDSNGKVVLTEGEFFITKHSNLEAAHIVFHLVVDSNGEALDNKSPLIAGIRKIIKTALHFDVTDITFPLLLRTESAQKRSDQSDMQRAELIVKNVKGSLIEHSRSMKGDHTTAEIINSGEPKTIQFMLGHEQADLFGRVTENIATIFRTS